MTLEVYQHEDRLHTVIINGYRVAGPILAGPAKKIFSTTVKRKHLQTAIERGDEEWSPCGEKIPDKGPRQCRNGHWAGSKEHPVT